MSMHMQLHISSVVGFGSGFVVFFEAVSKQK